MNLPSQTDRARVPRVAFVNVGILGLRSYAEWVRTTFADGRDIRAELILLPEGLTLRERVRRRLMCQRLWPDPSGWSNLDFARYRQELHAGVQARHRLLARGPDTFDVLHFNRQAAAYASLDLMRRIPSILMVDCTQTCALQDLTGRLERWTIGANVRRDGAVFDTATAIVSTSRWAAHDIRRMYPSCTTPIHVLGEPVALQWFDPSWNDARQARAAAGARPRALFVGGDFVRKGGYDLLEAWEAGGFGAAAELVLVTDWPINRSLPAGVVQRRRIAAHTPEWASMWRDADLFVMPTRNEALGLVYQEAAAAALPAIGTRLNAIPELIEEGRTGLLVTPRHQGELVRALRSLIDSAGLRHEMGREARRRVEARADPTDHRRRLVELIQAVVQREHG